LPKREQTEKYTTQKRKIWDGTARIQKREEERLLLGREKLRERERDSLFWGHD